MRTKVVHSRVERLYVIARSLRLFTTFDAVSSVAILTRSGFLEAVLGEPGAAVPEGPRSDLGFLRGD
jgi:hypothetical protein